MKLNFFNLPTGGKNLPLLSLGCSNLNLTTMSFIASPVR